MKITFLGTGTSQGVPIIGCKCKVCISSDPRDNRLRTSVLLRTESKTMIIDTGPDFRYQMLREQVLNLDAILYTHPHRDHIAGLDDVRALNFIHRKYMEIYAEESVLNEIRVNFSYAFSDVYAGRPRLNMNNITNRPFCIDDLEVVPVRMMHDALPILGFRIHDVCYLTDASSISKEEKKKIKNSKILIVNALRKQRHPTHFNLEQALYLIREMDPDRAYLTHISHQMGLHHEVSEELPENVFLAFDGLSIDV